jgi:hypothetical protein
MIDTTRPYRCSHCTAGPFTRQESSTHNRAEHPETITRTTATPEQMADGIAAVNKIRTMLGMKSL